MLASRPAAVVALLPRASAVLALVPASAGVVVPAAVHDDVRASAGNLLVLSALATAAAAWSAVAAGPASAEQWLVVDFVVVAVEYWPAEYWPVEYWPVEYWPPAAVEYAVELAVAAVAGVERCLAVAEHYPAVVAPGATAELQSD